MPNFLKSLFKPHRRQAPPQRASTSERDRATKDGEADKIEQLTAILQDRLGGRSDGPSQWRQHLVAGGGGNNESNGAISTTRKGNGRATLFDDAVCGCSEAIDSAIQLSSSPSDRFSQLSTRIAALLEAQRAELLDMRVYIEARRFPALVTLKQVYEKLGSGLEDVADMPERAGMETMSTLLGVAQEGPDYLLDIILLSALVFQAEIIDPSFGSEIRHILDRAIEDQSDLQTFRRATESVIAISAAIPRDLLDDREGEEAYVDMGVLLKQLQARVASTGYPTPQISEGTQSGTVTPIVPTSPILSATPSPVASPASSPNASSDGEEPDFAALSGAALQTRFGTGPMASANLDSGPLPGLSSYQASVRPAGPASPAKSESGESDASEEIWEYRGQQLTRSALDLVLREEALAQADSSGQYAGDVSWDSLRNAWIPKWVKKLKVSDLAEGEVPDTTPAGFQEREADEWGNQIGWYGPHKEMYYVEEPSFELRE